MRRTSAWGWWAFVVVLAGCPVVDEAVDADADGWPVPEDCDDGDWSVNPGAEEACGGGDEDCDGSTDEADAAGTSAWYADGDGDGFGAGAAVSACVAPSGHVAADGDCDDVAAGVNPGAAELCGGGDEDCDGSTDEADAAGTSAWYADGDGDGYGAGAAVSACAAPSGHVATDGDCDDVAAGVNPGAAELCGGGDEDCDRSTDEADAAGTSAWYADGDGDGYGAGAAVSACTAPAGHLATDGDCDDVAADVNPGAAELCGGGDEDCDGATDEADPDLTLPTWYRDADGDGFGRAAPTLTGCEASAGYAAQAGDCDDAAADVSPGARERCDAADRDEDCDGAADDDDADVDASTWTSWHRDLDGDGFGDAASSVVQCDAPAGFLADASDCADGDAAVNPAAAERCASPGVDDDCDGRVDDQDDDAEGLVDGWPDGDGDGWGADGPPARACEVGDGWSSSAGDCDDADAAVAPDAGETCITPWDDDCDGESDGADLPGCALWFADGDGDGYGGASTRCACEGSPDFPAAAAGDCDDAAPAVHPGVDEVCDPADVDEDCDGAADDASARPDKLLPWWLDLDGDGYGAGGSVAACDAPPLAVGADGDCDDAEALVSPEGQEVCGGGDEDCDGAVDDADASVDPAGFASFWWDADGDGWGGEASVAACAAPDGAVAVAGDCDDGLAATSPSAAESCATAWDDDCDGAVDLVDAVDCTPWFGDVDGDGFGGAATVCTCAAPDGAVVSGGDCDDGDGDVNPAAAERCDTTGVDDDCDGLADGADPQGAVGASWYLDGDGDGYGDSADAVEACAAPPGRVADATDCDDHAVGVYPGALDLPGDGADADCDGDDQPAAPPCTSPWSVPVPYATLAAAISAAPPAGVEICVGPGTFGGPVRLKSAQRLVGSGRGVTFITERIEPATSADNFNHVRHLTALDGIEVDQGYIEAVTARCTSATLAIDAIRSTIVRSDIACAGGDGVDLNLAGVLENSWVHDCRYGVLAEAASGGVVGVFSNTIVDNVIGVRAYTFGAARPPSPNRYEVYNNLLGGNGTGLVVVSAYVDDVWVQEGNVFWDNGVDGQVDVYDLVADPLLDAAYEPPRLSAASPALGTGTITYVSSVDYWGGARGEFSNPGCVDAPAAP